MSDITRFIYKESDESSQFFADFENYDTGVVNTQGFEDGDVALFSWNGKKYRGTLRQQGDESNGLFEVVNVKERI
jgi:hypothetical protein